MLFMYVVFLCVYSLRIFDSSNCNMYFYFVVGDYMCLFTMFTLMFDYIERMVQQCKCVT